MYASDQVWREVDAYFVDSLVAEDGALTEEIGRAHV